MPRKLHDDALGVTGAETIIGTGVVLTGNLKTESDITIDGNLDGHLTAGGDVTVGVNATINGDIAGVNVTVAGRLNGNIKAQDQASILQTGNVKGDIRAGGLAISPGAIFIGRSVMKDAPELGSPTPAEDASTPKA